jgi:hypothetical protein
MMNIDLTSTFKDARQLTNTWKARYSTTEYPQKVVLNIFYRKYTIDKMWQTMFDKKFSNWQSAYQHLKQNYGLVAQNEIAPFLERKIQANQRVTTIQFSDFVSFIRSASAGNQESIKGIEYTYFLHRILDELVIIWASMVVSGDTKINAIAKITRAVLAEMPINDYTTIEKIFDQLGAEQYLQTLFIKEMKNQL